MDLSFARTDQPFAASAMPRDLAVLLIGMSARQAASPTAARHALLTRAPVEFGLLSPAEGAFHSRVAIGIASWKQE